MIAADTNVLVRFLVNDQPAEAARAKHLIATQRLWVSKAVVLETEWVIRHVYRQDRQAVASSLQKLLGLSSLEFEDRSCLLQALRWLARGLDFADALHLASSGPATRFATFDRKLAQRAARIAEAPEVLSL